MSVTAMWVMYAVMHAPVGNHTSIWQAQTKDEVECRQRIAELPKAAQKIAVCMPEQDFGIAHSALMTWQNKRNK